MILRLELQTGILTELVPTPSFRRTAWFFLHVFIDEHRHGDLATHCGGFIFLLPPSLKRAGVAAKCWDLCVLPSSCCLCMTSCGLQHLVLNLPMKASSYSLTILPDWNCPEKWYLRDRCEVSPDHSLFQPFPRILLQAADSGWDRRSLFLGLWTPGIQEELIKRSMLQACG